MSPEWSLRFRSAGKNFVCVYYLPMRVTCSANLTLLDLIILLLHREYKSLFPLSCSHVFSSVSCSQTPSTYGLLLG